MAYGEHLDSTGAIRPAWRPLIEAFETLEMAELTRRREQALQLVHDNGVTYNVYGDPQGMDRPWALDLIPFVLSPEDWETIRSGLIQRMRVFSLALADLYGPQRLLKDRVIPPEVLYANPKFLRPCSGIRPFQSNHLTLFSSDIARAPSGGWMAMSDMTRTPSGMGYALENRIITSRIFPNLIQDCQVHRLAPFFERLRETLYRMSPRFPDKSHVVLLTPGPYNETYFEHVYLARYLGFTLVEGEDLSMRNEHVYLKTLKGLRPVDVLFRRLDDDYCDPLELKTDSTLGIVGLVQVLLGANVAVCNALGSGLLETPAFRPYLEDMCRFFLGEDLLHSSLPTWWCGNREQRRYVEENLESLLIGPAFNADARFFVSPAELDRAARAELLSAIQARPHEYVAQREPSLSTAPVWMDGAVKMQHVSLRCFALRDTAHDFHVMPGGLTRCSARDGLTRISMQEGSGSKDTWILSPAPVVMYSLLPGSDELVPLQRSSDNLPSRVADNLFWLGRYCERAEGSVRTLRYLVTRCTDESGLTNPPELAALARTVRFLWPDAQRFQELAMQRQNQSLDATMDTARNTGESPVEEAEIRALSVYVLTAIYEPQLASSVRTTLDAVQRVAWVVRDRFSHDSWRILRGLAGNFAAVDLNGSQPAMPDALLALNDLITGLAAFSGLTMENMTREPGWIFLDLGRRLERALHTAHLINSTLSTPIQPEEPILQAVLAICDSPMTYRARYANWVQPHAVLDLLLCDEANPRSVAFQLDAITEHLHLLPGWQPDSETPEETVVRELQHAIRGIDVTQAIHLDSYQVRDSLMTLLNRIVVELPNVSTLLARRYFSHTAAARQLDAKVLLDE
ncbi:MAG: hypothetical protein AMXMBFR84_09910 [Candidatus Hydrogenedentota bacterium]